jgi:hypothetical protein
VTVPAGAPASALAPGEDGPVWHTLRTDQVLQAEQVDGQHGLAVALSIVVVSEVRKAVARRHTAPSHPITR